MTDKEHRALAQLCKATKGTSRFVRVDAIQDPFVHLKAPFNIVTGVGLQSILAGLHTKGLVVKDGDQYQLTAAGLQAFCNGPWYKGEAAA